MGEAGTEWDEWLSLLEHTDYKENFLQGIVHYVTENPIRGSIRIKDNMLPIVVALLSCAPPTTVKLWLKNENVNVENVRALIHHQFSELSLQYHYQQPGNIPTSDTVLRVINR